LTYRQRLSAWVEGQWQEKDVLIDTLMDTQSRPR